MYRSLTKNFLQLRLQNRWRRIRTKGEKCLPKQEKPQMRATISRPSYLEKGLNLRKRFLSSIANVVLFPPVPFDRWGMPMSWEELSGWSELHRKTVGVMLRGNIFRSHQRGQVQGQSAATMLGYRLRPAGNSLVIDG